MTWSLDARLPIRFGTAEEAKRDAAFLIEGTAAAPPGRIAEHFLLPAGPTHPPGCTCCAGRSPAAQALSRLFLARARGEAPMFREIVAVASPAGQAAVRAAVKQDPLASAWFRCG